MFWFDFNHLHLIVHVLLLVELTLVLSGGVLVLLVLGHKVVHVGLSLGELLGDALPELLDSGRVTDEDGSHLQALRWDVANGGLDVVRDPLHEVRGVLVLDVEHLLVDLLGGHAATEEGGAGEVAAVTRVSSAHHVLSVEHLLGELGHGECTVLLGAAGGEWGEASEEEVEAREWDEIDTKLAEVGVELTRETQAARHAGHASGAQVVEVTIGRGGELEGTEADVVQSLVVKAHALISVLNQLVDGEGSVVRLHHGVGHLRGWHDGEGEHHAVGVLLTDLGDEEGSHTGTGAASEGMGQLEALEAIAGLGLLPNDVKDGVDQLNTLGVVTLCPVVTSTSLAEDEVVRAEELTEWASADGVHGTRPEVHQDSAGHVAASGSLVVVH